MILKLGKKLNLIYSYKIYKNTFGMKIIFIYILYIINVKFLIHIFKKCLYIKHRIK